jgi:hypothetical protein
MKIGFIEPGLHVCGGIRRIIEVSNRLVDRKHEVKLFTPQGRPCNWLPNQAPVFGLGSIHNHKFDIIIFNLAEQFRDALRVKAAKKVFWVLAPEAMYKHPDLPIKALRQKFHLIANSKFIVKYIHQYLKNIDYQIPIIPGGINPKHFKYVKLIPQNYHTMYYGSARTWKGTNLIEQALTPLHLRNLKMEGLNTPQEKLFTLYNSATVYISAGLVEGFNFPILEAMACGCPVICTDDGGNKDFVKRNVNAIVIPRNVRGIQTAVRQVLGNKSLRRKLRAEGLKTASEARFDWENVTDKFEKELELLLEK